MGIVGLCYSLSRFVPLVLNLRQFSNLNINTKRITSLSLRRLIKIHLFWYEFKWIRSAISTIYTSPEWEIEAEVQRETFIDQIVKFSIDQYRMLFSNRVD